MAGKMTPTVLKVLRGNPGGRRMNDREPQPKALAIACPRELEGLEARREWRRTIRPAIEIGLVTAADRMLAIAYCRLWETWRAQMALASSGPEVQVVGQNHFPMPSIARGMANRTLLLLIKTAAELGLSPTSRSKVQAPTGPRRGEVPTTGGALDRFLHKKGPA